MILEEPKISRLSVHYNDSGNHTGFGDWIKVAKPSIVYSLNGNIKDTLNRFSPATKIVYRVQNAYWARLPEGMFVGDASQNATRWMLGIRDNGGRTLMDVWALNPADYYDPLNEPVAHTASEAQWLNTWMMTALEIAHQRGFKLVMFSFGTANPAYESWQYLLPSLRLGKQYGAILSLHVYQDGSLLLKNPDGSYTDVTLNQTLRHRKVYAQYVPADAQLPILYSEASPNNGYGMGGMSSQAWINDMGAYDTELFKDAYIIGICGFQLGGSESNLQPALVNYGQYIASHPTPVAPPPLPESPNNTIMPPAEYISDGLHKWNLGVQDVHGFLLLRDGMQFAGGQGKLLLYYNHQVYTVNDLGQWYVAAESAWQEVLGDPRPFTVVKGIDVARYQGSVNWALVKRENKFAFIKATQGTSITDPLFATNWRNAKFNGIPRGAYHYYLFSQLPVDQAKKFIATLNGDYGELPLVVDMEDAPDGKQNDVLTFIEYVKKNTGRKVVIYTGKWWTDRYFVTPSNYNWATNYDLWIADYTHGEPIVPAPWTTWRFWQTGQGVVDGIAVEVDLNNFNGSVDDFNQYVASQSSSESPEGTTCPPSVITDYSGAKWSLGVVSYPAGYAVLKDGVQWNGGYAVLILYHDHTVYVKNAQSQWYKVTVSGWVSVSDPTYTAPPVTTSVYFGLGLS